MDVKPLRVPDEREARALALKSLLAFNRAVQEVVNIAVDISPDDDSEGD